MFVYAIGKLVLCSKIKKIVNIKEFLRSNINNLAIASIKHAPYGIAAREFLINSDLWDHISQKIIYGENINTVLHYVVTNSVDSGIIAMSQLMLINDTPNQINNFIEIPQELYNPLQQAAILLKNAQNNDMAYKFLDFLKRKDIQEYILNAGYYHVI